MPHKYNDSFSGTKIIVLAAYDLPLFPSLRASWLCHTDIIETVLQIHIRMLELLLIFNSSQDQLKKMKLVDNSYDHFLQKEVRSLSPTSYFYLKFLPKFVGNHIRTQ